MTPDELWREYGLAQPAYADLPTPEVEQFGYSAQMCDERVQQVLDGVKRATSDLLADYGQSPRGVPAPGDHWIVVDGRGAAAVVLRTTVTRIGTLSSADEEFARDDGFATVEHWQAEHREIFADNLPADTDGLELEPVLFERFALVWPTDHLTESDRTWIASFSAPS